MKTSEEICAIIEELKALYPLGICSLLPASLPNAPTSGSIRSPLPFSPLSPP